MGVYKLFVVATVLSATLWLQAPTASAAEEKKDTQNPYSYTAKAGDNYSVLARKAVQTYGIREKVNLSQAQIIAAETALASAAGFPELNEGQAVSFDSAKVKKAMEDAKKITGDALVAWQSYVPYVNFDTRNNG